MALLAELIANGVSTVAAPLLTGLVVATGLLGAIVAFVKLSGDRSTASVTQAQGAADAIAETLAAVERERAYWERRYTAEHKYANDLAAQVANLERQLKGGTP